MIDRFEQLRRHIAPGMAGVEIGPFYNPIAPKAAGYNTVVVDMFDRSTLIERAKAIPTLSPELIGNIEDVDILLRDGDSLAEACLLRKPQGFDFLVGSHSLEHVPDLLGFFKDASRFLTPQAIITFAVPDLRFCFDFFKPHTTTGALLHAHRLGRKRHLPEMLFDGVALAATRDGAGAWVRKTFDVPRADNDLDAAYAVYLEALQDEGRQDAPYRDTHCWFFTPAIFELVAFDLNVLGLMPFKVTAIEENLGSEFVVHMNRGEESRTQETVRERRNTLLRRATRELMDRYPW